MLNKFTNYRIFVILALFSISSSVLAQSIKTKDVSSLFSEKQIRFTGDASLEKGVLLDMDKNLLSRLYDEANFSITMALPLDYNEEVVLELTKVNLLTKDFILRSSGGDTLDYQPGLYYRGEIVGHEGFCAISLHEGHVAGLIAIKGKGDYNLGQIKNQRSTDYIIYNDRHLNREDGFQCHTEDPAIEDLGYLDEKQEDFERVDDCVKLYIEGDYELFQDKGGVSGASNYITDIVNEVAALYGDESIGIEISEIMVWDSPDGYDQDDAGIALDQFEANNPTFNGDLAQLFALGGNGTGGLAWVDVLCGWRPYAYENISANFNNYPAYSWTIEVVAHEMGHNLGSRHTHACVWNGDQIDDCGNVWADNNGQTPEGNACFDENNPILPNDGTVMSYCHLLNVGIDLGLGFGPLPGNLIRNRVNNANCLSACDGGLPDAPIADFDSDVSEICEGEYIQFYDMSANTPTEWYWVFEGGSPIDSDAENPYILYENEGVFDVELEVTNVGGSDYLFFDDYVTVLAAPNASFDYSVVNYREVSFINNSENADSYFWEFGDGDISYEAEPVHLYENDGVYEVTLYAEHDLCSESIAELIITIVSPPTAGISIPENEGCKPITIEFEDGSTPNVTSWSWQFEGGTPATSNDQNPSISYNTAGEYTVSLTVANSLYSDMIVYTDTVKISDIAQALYTPVINGNIVNFTNNSVDADSYYWDFGDGNNSTEENPAHTYTAGGTYSTQLIATNDCGNDTTQIQIEIAFEATAGFLVEFDMICVNDTAYFSSLANTNEIEWHFEGGSPATSDESNPKVVYSTPGSYMVTQYAYNQLGGDTLEIDNFITVLADPSGSIGSQVDAYSATFTQNLSNSNGFLWSFGDGSSSSDENPSHTYEFDGSYTVTLTVFGTCDTLVLTEIIEIANPPIASFTQDVTSGCASLTVQYTNQSSPNSDQFEWTFEGGNPSSSTDENPVVIYENPGIYSVMLQSFNEQGQDVTLLDDLIYVSGTPQISFGYNSNLLTVQFNYQGDPDEFESWDFGDGNTSTQLNPSHTYASEGFYTITLNASNDCGDSEVFQTIEVAIRPEANFEWNVDSGCVPLTVKYTDQTVGNPSSLVWLFEGGTPSSSTEEDPVVVYYEGGTFTTRLIAFSNNGNDTLTMEEIISVDAGPDPDFYFTINGGTVSFFNQTEEADSYIWNFGDGTLSLEENPSHTYGANGQYTVTLFATNECGQNATEILITVSTVNTLDLTSIQHVKLYPNPNNGSFELKLESIDQQKLDMTMYSLIGSIIDKQNLQVNTGSNYLQFNYSDLEKGFYILQLDNGKEVKRLKFAIQ